MNEFAIGRRLVATAFLALGLAACSSEESDDLLPSPGPGGAAPIAGVGNGGASGSATLGGTGGGSGGVILNLGGKTQCTPKTCAELGWECGSFVNDCGGITDCAKEGLTCGGLESCVGGVDGPAQCETSFGPCEVCSGIPDCDAQGTPTRLVGRVVTPGRMDADTANQVGVPNAVVYILRSTDPAELPAITAGVPMGGTSCDRCSEQDLGPSLVGAVTDATGKFTLEGSIPVGTEFLFVVKVGKFRRAIKHTLPAAAACQTTELPAALPGNPTRLPRAMDDGIAVNIPAVAVSTGRVDAMECVLEKMGLAHGLFGNPGPIAAGTPRIHLFRGGPNEIVTEGGIGMGMAMPIGGPAGSGAYLDEMTPHDSTLYGQLAALQTYDFVVSDCEGQDWENGSADTPEAKNNLREYVNRGGRLFSSHLSFTWLNGNGMQAFDPADPIATGLGPAGTWSLNADTSTQKPAVVSVGRPDASPRIQNFADWLAREGVIMPPDNTFDILEPRSQNTGLGESSEEFVYRPDNDRVQQFSFNTPYGAPDDAVCGRVAHSGFHVSAGDAKAAVFPMHCSAGLTKEEKVLLYMLFDLGACIGDPPPPPECVPETCESLEAICGFRQDGCGKVVDCGPCPPPE